VHPAGIRAAFGLLGFETVQLREHINGAHKWFSLNRSMQAGSLGRVGVDVVFDDL